MTPQHQTEDRRASRRIPLSMRITIHYTEGDLRWTEDDATLVDVSAAGMFIRCDRVPRAGQHILVGVMHNESGLCAAWGETVRFDDWGGFGVQFKRTNEALSDFVDELAGVDGGQRNEVVTKALDARVWIDADDPF